MNNHREQIPLLVAKGLEALQHLLTVLVTFKFSEAAIAESYLARFKIWVGSFGAHRATGTRSLEYRLRDASSIRGHIASLLEDLHQIIINDGM